MENLKSFSIRGANEIEDEHFMDELEDCVNLEHLDLSMINFQSNLVVWRSISKLINLKRLRIESYAARSGESAPKFDESIASKVFGGQNMSNLEYIKFTNLKVNEEALQIVGNNCPNLEYASFANDNKLYLTHRMEDFLQTSCPKLKSLFGNELISSE